MRFPGFEDEWETNKLAELSIINPKNENLPSSFIYIDLESVSNGHLSKEVKISKNEAPSRAQRKLERGDILFQMVRPYQKNNLYFDKEGEYVASTGYAQIRTTQNSQFIFQYLHNQKFVDRVIELCTGTSYPAINSSDLGNIHIHRPEINEQNKIAQFLELLDNRIQTQNKIIEKLETLIKGISDDLFSQKYRFSEFTEDWSIHVVSDFLEFFSTNSLSWENLEYRNSSFLNLHYGLIHQGIPTQIDLTECYLPGIKTEYLPNKYTFCQDGDVAFADASEDTNDVAKVVEFINCDNKKIVCGLHTIHARDKLNITVRGFKGYAFSSKLFRNQIRQLAQGTKVFSVSAKTFKECCIKVPAKNEQLKITNILSLIDRKIASEKKLLAQFNQQKMYLLQNLFI